MDCHGIFSKFHGMTTKAKDERQTAKMETAFFYGFPITTFGNDKKEENGFILLWIATTFGHAMTTTAKDERQTAKRETAFFYGFPITTFGNDEK